MKTASITRSIWERAARGWDIALTIWDGGDALYDKTAAFASKQGNDFRAKFAELKPGFAETRAADSVGKRAQGAAKGGFGIATRLPGAAVRIGLAFGATGVGVVGGLLSRVAGIVACAVIAVPALIATAVIEPVYQGYRGARWAVKGTDKPAPTTAVERAMNARYATPEEATGPALTEAVVETPGTPQARRVSAVAGYQARQISAGAERGGLE